MLQGIAERAGRTNVEGERLLSEVRRLSSSHRTPFGYRKVSLSHTLQSWMREYVGRGGSSTSFEVTQGSLKKHGVETRQRTKKADDTPGKPVNPYLAFFNDKRAELGYFPYKSKCDPLAKARRKELCEKISEQYTDEQRAKYEEDYQRKMLAWQEEFEERQACEDPEPGAADDDHVDLRACSPWQAGDEISPLAMETVSQVLEAKEGLSHTALADGYMEKMLSSGAVNDPRLTKPPPLNMQQTCFELHPGMCQTADNLSTRPWINDILDGLTQYQTDK